MRRLAAVFLGAVMGVTFVATCGPSRAPGTVIGDMAGAVDDLLVLAGVDLKVADSAASPPMAADCNKTWTVTAPGYKQVYYYAEFSVPGFDPMLPDHLTSVVCDEIINGKPSPTVYDCSPGVMCDPPPPDTRCTLAAVAGYGNILGNGVVRVGCGFEMLTPGMPTTGYRFQRAYLKVGQ